MPPTDSIILNIANGASECEKNVIKKLIRVVELALSCSEQRNSTDIGSQDEVFAKQFMELLLNQDDTRIVEENITNVLVQSTTTIVSDNGKSGSDNGKSLHRLQHLEMIKVAVLIFVISIIMLTTCKMVFQLFVRFRPEKHQFH